MSDTTTASASSTASTVRLPLAELPATVLPGAVITLALVTDQARRAVEAAKGAGDGRVLLRAGDGALDDPSFVVLFGRAGRLRGALGVNAARHLMAYQRLLAERATWDDAMALAATQRPTQQT